MAPQRCEPCDLPFEGAFCERCGAPMTLELSLRVADPIRLGAVGTIEACLRGPIGALRDLTLRGRDVVVEDAPALACRLESEAGTRMGRFAIEPLKAGDLHLMLELTAFDGEGRVRSFKGRGQLPGAVLGDESGTSGSQVIFKDKVVIGGSVRASDLAASGIGAGGAIEASVRLRYAETGAIDEDEVVALQYVRMEEWREAWQMLQARRQQGGLSAFAATLHRDVRAHLRPAVRKQLEELARQGRVSSLGALLESEGEVLGPSESADWRGKVRVFEREIGRAREALSEGDAERGRACCARARKAFPDNAEAARLEGLFTAASEARKALAEGDGERARRHAVTLVGVPGAEAVVEEAFGLEPGPPRLCLASPEQRHDYQLVTASEALVGRAFECDVLLVDLPADEVSKRTRAVTGRFHAWIRARAGNFALSLPRLDRNSGAPDPEGPTRRVLIDGDEFVSPPPGEEAREMVLNPGSVLDFEGRCRYRVEAAGLGDDPSALLLRCIHVPEGEEESLDIRRSLLMGDRGIPFGIDDVGGLGLGPDVVQSLGVLVRAATWVVAVPDPPAAPFLIVDGEHQVGALTLCVEAV